jgi:hypothetical protein
MAGERGTRENAGTLQGGINVSGLGFPASRLEFIENSR